MFVEVVGSIIIIDVLQTGKHKRAKTLHRRVAQAPVQLHREGYEAVAIQLHSGIVHFCLSRCEVAAPAVAAAWERVLGEVGWMTEMSTMEMPWGMARKTLP
jgi:hypothetical protein